MEDGTGRGLAGVRLELLGHSRTWESDDGGEFALTGLADGEATVVVRRIGFAPETLVVSAHVAGTKALLIQMRRMAQPLAPVVVRGRLDLRGPLAGFYQRRERGLGHFFTEEQLARRDVRRMSDLVRSVPGMRVDQRQFGNRSVRLRGSGSPPMVWLDGTPMASGPVDLDVFDPRSFAAIEIYSGPASVPVEFTSQGALNSSSGTILLWTKQGQARPRRRRPGDPSPAVLVAGMLDRREAFTADSVDSPAYLPMEGTIVPIYPDSLYSARRGGRVEVEFVVDANGRVLMDTFGVMSTTHPALVESISRAVGERMWVPASRGGVAVAQLVQLPFEFRPETGRGVSKPDV